MPPRRRHSRRRRVALTARRELALTIGPNPLGDEPDGVLVAVYAEHRDRILDRLPNHPRPWAWWRFEPGVPGDLRGERPQLRPVNEPRPDDADLDRRRRAWLAERAAQPVTTITASQENA